jgi:hypothetical protein
MNCLVSNYTHSLYLVGKDWQTTDDDAALAFLGLLLDNLPSEERLYCFSG